ncbi:MAG: hypothetical protein ACTSRG_14145 [Candidatus Helarchaeota archaeon]
MPEIERGNSNVTDTFIIFCPRCKKKTKMERFLHIQYTCSECGLSFKPKDYSKILKEYSFKKNL